MKKLVPSPEEVEPIEAREFMDAYVFAMTVSRGNVPDQIRNPREHKFRVEDRVVALNDIPMNRFGLALAQKFDGRDATFRSFMWRFWALLEMLESPLLSDFVRTREGVLEAHPAILFVAAQMRLNAKLQFDEQAFVSEVGRIAPTLEVEE
jgi:hypothetical protein